MLFDPENCQAIPASHKIKTIPDEVISQIQSVELTPDDLLRKV